MTVLIADHNDQDMLMLQRLNIDAHKVGLKVNVSKTNLVPSENVNIDVVQVSETRLL